MRNSKYFCIINPVGIHFIKNDKEVCKLALVKLRYKNYIAPIEM